MSGPSLDSSLEATAEDIASMEIRGAATIAAAAAGALRSQAVESTASEPAVFEETMRAAGRRLHQTRRLR